MGFVEHAYIFPGVKGHITEQLCVNQSHKGGNYASATVTCGDCIEILAKRKLLKLLTGDPNGIC